MEKSYYVAKGLIAIHTGDDMITPLFMATFADMTRPRLEDVSFYIDRKILLPIHKEVKAVVDIFNRDHPGDVIYTGEIYKRLRYQIEVPEFPSLQARRDYTARLVQQSLTVRRANNELDLLTFTHA